MSKKPVKSSLFRFVTLRVPKSETLKEYCNKCGDYVGEGCDNNDCKDFKAKQFKKKE